MKKKAPRLYCLEQPKSANADLFRSIRSNIRYTRVGGEIRSILVTSSLPEEGKSTVAMNLAIAMAETGRTVLLIDGDLRSPTVHKAFNLTNWVGLSSILVDQTRVEDCIYSIQDVQGLSVLTSGPVSPNPAELLGSEGMKDLFAELSEQWDTIVIDSSSVLMPFSDVLTLARMAEGVLLVVKSGKVLQKHAIAAKQLLEQQGAHLLGAVLNHGKNNKRQKIRGEDFAVWASSSGIG
ncbi:capsular exopolysaccharide synthesis family protein [Paenibacillus anaericanus]|uniref:CpsD/CapB family tyrosine-protein kinase n=1 Tax=Paenibacillus anaericanus TaxID=170367 RepID=UPI0027857670|nr:CpsD/CapB family tyrosine-protein kinase [Paenibacillus anaericanus]MDQ0088601.1 capsular exopolysaccharide synthesis family protein [Paenibacillus anaericanus]